MNKQQIEELESIADELHAISCKAGNTEINSLVKRLDGLAEIWNPPASVRNAPTPPPMRKAHDDTKGAAIMDLICIATIFIAGVVIGWIMRG